MSYVRWMWIEIFAKSWIYFVYWTMERNSKMHHDVPSWFVLYHNMMFYRFAFVDDLDDPGIPRVSNAVNAECRSPGFGARDFCLCCGCWRQQLLRCWGTAKHKVGAGLGKVLHRCPNETCWCHMTHVVSCWSLDSKDPSWLHCNVVWWSLHFEWRWIWYNMMIDFDWLI
jgi:hypothetical protein